MTRGSHPIFRLRPLLTCSAVGFMAACQGAASSPLQESIPEITPARASAIDSTLSRLVEEHDLVTLGAAVIRGGEMVWSGYYGEHAPGVPASVETQFNVASITKTVTAETILRLVDQGHLTLDESMAPAWIDPDVKDDPRHVRLTPRMALTHTTGFLNWRFFAEDNVLRFVNDPGTTFGYSGEGFEYLARFAEAKIGRPFEELVREQIFEPYGMTGVSFSVRESNFPSIARAVDEDGEFHGYYCRPGASRCPEEGRYSAADDMVVTVPDYAAFMIAVMEGRGYGAALQGARDSVHLGKGREPAIDCARVAVADCPIQEGYGLGWVVIELANHKLVGHGGSDWSELATTYFYPESGDGLLVFINAPNERTVAPMTEAIEVLDPGSLWASMYRKRLSR